MASKTIKDLWASAAELEKEGEDVANFSGSVAKLPTELATEFRKAQDPKLDQAINKAQSDTFGAAIKGLDMYQDISNPFARRSLAEQYQGGIEQGWKNLVDERTRRQGVYSDYIEKWTGLFGAEAARKQSMFQNKLSAWDREKNLADTEENNRRWETENARANRGSGSKNDRNSFTSDAVALFNESVGKDGKVSPEVYREIRDMAMSGGYYSRSEFDDEFGDRIGDFNYHNVGIETKNTNTIDNQIKEENLKQKKIKNEAEQRKQDAINEAMNKKKNPSKWASFFGF
jgi:hypothetical protein